MPTVHLPSTPYEVALTLAGVFVLLAIGQWIHTNFLANLPPGPPSLPIIGNLFWIPLKQKPKGLREIGKVRHISYLIHIIMSKILFRNMVSPSTDVLDQTSLTFVMQISRGHHLLSWTRAEDPHHQQP